MTRLGGHLERLRACFAGLPDPRRGRNRRYAMADVAMAALSVFFMQSPSFLAHQRALAEGRTRSNAHTLFGLARIPCDNHIRHGTLACRLLDGIRLPTRRATAGARRRIHRYRWMTGLPIRDGDDALRVNWLEITSARPDGTVTYRGTFVTSLDVDRDNVAELADCARARWKIENETFNVLKQHGYHLEHNFGHGNDARAGVLVVLNLLAFSLHSACELAETLWQSARRRLGTRRRLFEHLRTVTEYQVFPDWNALLSLLATGGTAAQPP